MPLVTFPICFIQSLFCSELLCSQVQRQRSAIILLLARRQFLAGARWEPLQHTVVRLQQSPSVLTSCIQQTCLVMALPISNTRHCALTLNFMSGRRTHTHTFDESEHLALHMVYAIGRLLERCSRSVGTALTKFARNSVMISPTHRILYEHHH